MLTELANSISSGAINRGIAIASSLRESGLYLVAALFAWFLCIRALKLAADQSDSLADFFGDLIEKLVMAAIVFWLLEATIYSQFIKDWMWEPFRTLAFKAAGLVTSTPGTTGLAALEEGLDRFQDCVMGSLTKSQDALPAGANPITWLLNAIKVHFVSFVIAGLVIVILAIGKALAVGAFCIGAVTFGVGASLGPLFLPLLVSDRLSNYFWSWFRFMIVSAATLLVAVIVVLLLAEAMKPLAGGSGSVTQECTALVGSASMNDLDFTVMATKAIVISIFMAFVLSQIPEITNALFSGSTAGVRSGASSAFRAITGAARSGGSRAKGEAESLYRKFRGGDGDGGGRGGGGSGGGAPSGGLAAVRDWQKQSQQTREAAMVSRATGRPSSTVSREMRRASPEQRQMMVSSARATIGDRQRENTEAISRIADAAEVDRDVAAQMYDAASPEQRQRMLNEADQRLSSRDAGFQQASAAGERAQSTHPDWLPRNARNQPVVTSPEAVDRAAAAGDPLAQGIVRARDMAGSESRRRDRGSGASSLKRVTPSKPEDETPP